MPDDVSTGRQLLYDRYATTHAGAGHGYIPEVLDRDVIRHLCTKGRSDDRLIIDLGCGQGDLVRYLATRGFSDVIGVDRSPEQVAIALDRGAQRVREGDADAVLSDCRGTVQAVTATDFLEHLQKDELLRTVSEIQQSLADDGILIARVPNAASPFGGSIRHGDMTHESSFTARSIQQLAAATGFSEVSIFPCPPIAHGTISMIRSLIWRFYSAFFKLGLAAETGTFDHLVTQNIVFVARKSE